MSEDPKPGSGDAQEVKRGPGRPKGTTKAKKRERQLVRVMAADNLEHEAIARAINVSVEELERDFSEELLTTKDRLNAEVAAKLHDTALSGTKAEAFRAQELWLRCNAGWHEYAPKAYQPQMPVKPAEPKPEKLGKKEQAKADAQKGPPKKSGWSDLVN